MLVSVIGEPTQQVVAGILYKINVRVGPSTCKKDEAATATCQLQSENDVKECEITAWYKLWVDKENPVELKVNCK